MKVGNIESKTYNVSTEKGLSFSIEQRIINQQVFVNYRSLSVKVDKLSYKPESCGNGINKRLSKEIKDFLTDRANVLHLNLISQVLNKWNYFEIYRNDMGQLAHVENNTVGSNSGDMPQLRHVENNTVVSNSGDMGGSAHVKIDIVEVHGNIPGSGDVKFDTVGSNSGDMHRFAHVRIDTVGVDSEDIPRTGDVENDTIVSDSGDVPGSGHVENDTVGVDSEDMPRTGHVKNDTVGSNSEDIPQLGDVKIELIGDSDDKLLSNKVLENVNSNVEIEGPFTNTISYYPIWKWDGNRKNSRAKHWIHFDLLVYILSNVFVQFRKEFMSLVTVELQLSNVKDIALDETRSLHERELEMRLEQITKENISLKDEIQLLNSNLERAHMDLVKTNEKNIELNSNLEIANSNLEIANSNLEKANSKIDELNGRIDTLNRKLRTFTPSNSTTNSIRYYLRLYLSDRHPRSPSMRAKAVDGKIWIGIYCGELQNYSRTIRDPRARVIVTYPVNSRDSLVYISDIIGVDFIEYTNYKHWLVSSNTLPDIIDQIADTLIDHDAIDGQIELNNDVLDSIIDVEPAVVAVIEPDPITTIQTEYNTDEITKFEYYYRKYYRRIEFDESIQRLYFHIGTGRNRIREYITSNDLSRMVKRPL